MGEHTDSAPTSPSGLTQRRQHGSPRAKAGTNHPASPREGGALPKDAAETIAQLPSWQEQLSFRSYVVGTCLGVLFIIIGLKLSLGTAGIIPSLNIPGGLISFAAMKSLAAAGGRMRTAERAPLTHRLLFQPFGLQENAVMQTFVLSMGAGGFGSYLTGMGYQAYLNMGGAPKGSPGFDASAIYDPVPSVTVPFLLMVSILGAFLLTQMRKLMICEWRLPFPSGTASGIMLTSFHTANGAADAIRKVKYLCWTGLGSFCFSIFKWFLAGSDYACGFTTWPTFGFAALELTWNFDWQLNYVGAGMICPHIVNWSMLLGAVLSWGIMWPLMAKKEGDWFPAGLGPHDFQGLFGYKVFLVIAILMGEGLYMVLKVLVSSGKDTRKRMAAARAARRLPKYSRSQAGSADSQGAPGSMTGPSSSRLQASLSRLPLLRWASGSARGATLSRQGSLPAAPASAFASPAAAAAAAASACSPEAAAPACPSSRLKAKTSVEPSTLAAAGASSAGAAPPQPQQGHDAVLEAHHPPVLADGLLVDTDQENEQNMLQFKETPAERRLRTEVFLRETIPWWLAPVGYGSLAIISTICIPFVFAPVKWYHVLVAYLITPLFALPNSYGAGLTDWDCASMYGKLALFVFAAWAGVEGNGVIVGLAICGVVLNATSSAATLMGDFRTAYICLAAPRAMFAAQVVGQLLGCILTPFAFMLFFKTGQVAVPGGPYPAPFSSIYRGMAEIGTRGFSALPKHCTSLMLGFFVAGIVLCAVRDMLPKRWARWAPSPTALSIPFYIGAASAINFWVGSLVIHAWEFFNASAAEELGPTVGAGLLVGDGLWAIPSSLLAIVGKAPPFCLGFFPCSHLPYCAGVWRGGSSLIPKAA